jgi:hypothetical protein
MSSSKRQQDVLAQNAAALVHGGRWPLHDDLTPEDWHHAADLLTEMALLNEPGARARGEAALERVAQQYERWLAWRAATTGEVAQVEDGPREQMSLLDGRAA